MPFLRLLLFKEYFVLLAIALMVSVGFALPISAQSSDRDAITSSPSNSSAVPSSLGSIGNQLLSPTGAVIAGCVVGMFFLGNANGNSNNKLAQGHWATAKEISSARKKAREQINRRERNKTSLFIVSPHDRPSDS